MNYTFDDPAAAERHETQYFEMMCNRGIYPHGLEAGHQHPTRGVLPGAAKTSQPTCGSSTTRPPTGPGPDDAVTRFLQ
jgi:hypothetical protein